MNTDNIFGKRLTSARKMAGLSLQALADKLGNVITKQSLNKYEQGIMKPDSSILIALANILNVSVDFFFYEPLENLTLDNVIKTTVFLADINDFAEINEIYEEAFGDNKPARSCVQAGALPKGALIEIEVIAVK